jgi:rhodanese-related sulfurtransferase
MLPRPPGSVDPGSLLQFGDRFLTPPAGPRVILFSMPESTLEVTPQEVKQRLDAGRAIRLIDVREPFEHQQARIDGADLIPMRTVPAHLADLQTEDRELVVLCHHGVRSLQVVHWLREHGVPLCHSMSGGIDRWSLEIEPSVPRY